MIWMFLSGYFLGDDPPPQRAYFRRVHFRLLYVQTRTVTTRHPTSGADSVSDTGWSDPQSLFVNSSGRTVYPGDFVNPFSGLVAAKNGSSTTSTTIYVRTSGLKMDWRIVNELTSVKTSGSTTVTTVSLEDNTIAPVTEMAFNYSFSGTSGSLSITRSMICVYAEGVA